MNDYEAHLSSYDHSHRQRMKDMKQMVKDPTAGARARKAEAKADGLISIKLGEAGAGSGSGSGGGGTTAAAGAAGAAGAGFKKGGFKKAGFKSAFSAVDGGDEDAPKPATAGGGADAAAGPKAPRDETAESDTEDEGYEVYDPRFPTDY